PWTARRCADRRRRRTGRARCIWFPLTPPRQDWCSPNKRLMESPTRSRRSRNSWTCSTSRARSCRSTPWARETEIARRIVDKGADYVLALKGNQTSLHEDAALFFADPVCAAECAASAETDAGHGRVEERSCRAAEASWLAERHPDWKDLRSIAAVTARRIDKKTGRESLETRYYITSLKPDPKAILGATRAHWGIEIFHWTLDVTFDEDRCRTRKDASPLNF